VFPDIHHLFINQISANLDIKNLKIRLLIMLGVRLFFWVKNLQKLTSFFKKGIFCRKYIYFKKGFAKENHKLIKKR
jgi:hypothetical protein